MKSSFHFVKLTSNFCDDFDCLFQAGCLSSFSFLSDDELIDYYERAEEERLESWYLGGID